MIDVPYKIITTSFSYGDHDCEMKRYVVEEASQNLSMAQLCQESKTMNLLCLSSE